MSVPKKKRFKYFAKAIRISLECAYIKSKIVPKISSQSDVNCRRHFRYRDKGTTQSKVQIDGQFKQIGQSSHFCRKENTRPV